MALQHCESTDKLWQTPLPDYTGSGVDVKDSAPVHGRLSILFLRIFCHETVTMSTSRTHQARKRRSLPARMQASCCSTAGSSDRVRQQLGPATEPPRCLVRRQLPVPDSHPEPGLGLAWQRARDALLVADCTPSPSSPGATHLQEPNSTYVPAMIAKEPGLPKSRQR